MSGHSHWHSIRHKKQLEDQKRGKIFSKLSRQISVAAKEGGKDPETNSKLRLAIEQAKSFNMPSDRIERAIKRGTGELKGAQLESVTFEAFGPGKIAIIIEGITDNKNRTLNELKQVLNKYGGKLAQEGSVKWMFKRMGCITIDQNSQQKNKDELEMVSIESGAEDIKWRDSLLEVYVKPESLEQTKAKLKERGIEIESATLDWMPEQEIETNQKEKEAAQKLFSVLDELEAVQEIYSNLKT
jgi:YebC/PmpR family DNA-binding regulatory protein